MDIQGVCCEVYLHLENWVEQYTPINLEGVTHTHINLVVLKQQSFETTPHLWRISLFCFMIQTIVSKIKWFLRYKIHHIFLESFGLERIIWCAKGQCKYVIRSLSVRLCLSVCLSLSLSLHTFRACDRDGDNNSGQPAERTVRVPS